MKERQVIVTWYTPEEKLPSEDEIVVVTASGEDGHMKYDHALLTASFADDGCGWMFVGCSDDADLTVHAWADLEPFGDGR